MPSPVKNILALTRDMLCAAESGDWEALDTLEAARSSQLSGLLVDLDNVEQSENALVKDIESILDLNRQIIDLCSTESTSCKNQLRDCVKGRQAIASYYQFTG